MKIVDVEQNTDEWLELRKGKIGGTDLGAMYSKRGGRKIGFYEVIAQRLGIERDHEDRMERGHRLEQEAIDKFTEITGKTVDRVGICVADFNDDIINSPDGLIKGRGKNLYTEAIEVKCLSPARHLQAVIEDKVPDEFESQKLQYFIVNEDLQTLYFVFYDPSIPSVPIHTIEVLRADNLEKIEQFKQFQIEQLAEMDEIVERLAF